MFDRPESDSALTVAEPQQDLVEHVAGPQHDLRHTMISQPVAQQAASLMEYKERRDYFREWLWSQLQEGLHYGYPPGCEPNWARNKEGVIIGTKDWKGNLIPLESWQPKPSLYASGADFVCEICGLRDEYQTDEVGWKMMGGITGLAVVRCRLFSRQTGELIGESLGSYLDAKKAEKESNKTFKMASKCLGGETPILMRSERGIVRTDLCRAFEHDGPIEIAGPGGWRKVLQFERMPLGPVKYITFQNGSRVAASLEHLWPLEDGRLVPTSDLTVGNIVKRTRLPSGDGIADLSIGWLVGICAASGSISKDSVRFHVSTKETVLAARIQGIASKFGVDAAIRINKSKPNASVVHCNGKCLVGMMLHFLNGSGSRSVRLSVNSWRQSPDFLKQVLKGYLDGNGSRVTRKGRKPFYSLAFTGKNRELANDLKTLCAILDYRCKIAPGTATVNGKTYATFTGWIKTDDPAYNEQPLGRIVSLEDGRRVTYELEVDGDHLFCLADGTVTHNCAKVGAIINAYGLRDLFTQDEKPKPPRGENPTGDRAAPKADPRANRGSVTPERLAEIAKTWKGQFATGVQLEDQAAFKSWVQKTVGRQFNPGSQANWTETDAKACYTELDIPWELPMEGGSDEGSH